MITPILAKLTQGPAGMLDCRLPPSWDRSEPFLATFMGPPGLPVMGPPACRALGCAAIASDSSRSTGLEGSGGVPGGGGDRDSGSVALLVGRSGAAYGR